MVLDNKLGLTEEDASRFVASQTKITAGNAAQLMSNKTKVKIYAKDIIALYDIYYKSHMKWDYCGFFRHKYGSVMDRTYFITQEELGELIENFASIYPRLQTYKQSEEEMIFPFYWIWDTDSHRTAKIKVLKVYEGSRTNLPSKSTECDKYVFKVASKYEGRIYWGREEPKISDFIEEAHQMKLANIKNIFHENDWYTYRYRRCKAFMGYKKAEFEAAVKKHFERQNRK